MEASSEEVLGREDEIWCLLVVRQAGPMTRLCSMISVHYPQCE